jgi:hypothetical protein
MVLTAAFAIAMAGCGRSDLVPVEGTVTLDGAPLTGATIGMELVGGAKDFRLFTAETDATGRFALKPFEHAGTGALPGEYHVLITSVKAPPGSHELTVLPAERVPLAYRNGSQKISVPTAGTTAANFDLKTR